jgi:hypothetical protein
LVVLGEKVENISEKLYRIFPSCMNADDIQQLLQEIPVHQPVVVPVNTVQEAAPQELPQEDSRGAECHPGKQPGPQPMLQRTASDILLH